MGTVRWQCSSGVPRAASSPRKKQELVALWDEYVKTNGVIIGVRSPFERARKALPDPMPEFDDYPPLRGVEAIPYEDLLKLMGK